MRTHSSTALAYAPSKPLMQLDRFRDRLFNRALIALSLAMLPGLAASVIYIGWSPAYLAQLALALLLGLVAFGERRGGFVLRIAAFLVIVWSTDLVATVLHGPTGLGNGVLMLFLLGGMVLLAESGVRALVGVTVLALAALFSQLASQPDAPGIVEGASGELLLGALSTYYFLTFSAIGAWMVGSLLLASRRSLERSQKALGEAERQATISARFKDHFVRNVDRRLHESLEAGVQAMRQLADDPALVDGASYRSVLLGQVRESTEGVLALVEALMDLAKTESGQCDLSPKVWPCAQRLREIAELAGSTASERGIRLRFEVTETLPERLYSDIHRIRQILLTILVNCVEYTERGEVVMRVACRRHLLRIEIEDTGTGMSDTDMEYLFEPYVCVGTNHQRLRGGGYGLGLAVTRSLMESIGGTLHYHADMLHGRRFLLEIPVVEVPSLGEFSELVKGRHDVTIKNVRASER